MMLFLCSGFFSHISTEDDFDGCDGFDCLITQCTSRARQLY